MERFLGNRVTDFILVATGCVLFAFAQSSVAAEAPKWTLEQVKKIAFEHNPDLMSAKANYQAASKGVGVAFSGYLPHVAVTAQYEQTTLPSPSAGSTDQLGTDLPYAMARASITQTVFDFGKVLNRIGVSRALSNEAEQDAVTVKNALELAVERAFYQVESTAQLVDVAKKGLDKYNETLRRTQVLVRTGSRPQFDLTQAKVEVGKAKFVVTNAINIHQYARITLLDLMGLQNESQEQTPFSLVDQGTPEEFVRVHSEKLVLPKLIERALKSRPEVKKQEFAVDAAHSAFAEATKDYFPTVYVQGWVGKYLPDYPVAISDSWGVGIGLTWHLFDGLETTFRTAQLSDRVDSAAALVDKNKLTVTSQVTRGYQDLVKSEENLNIAEESLSASRENLNLAQKRYDVSVATILELLIAENSLLNAEATAVTAHFDHELALASLKQAVNGPLTE